MCGIGAILRADGKPIPKSWLEAIDRRIAYRGPDGEGEFRDQVRISGPDGKPRNVEVALIHRRLSIIDHTGGGQPMVSKRGRDPREGLVAVVFNGCIYNHRELRRELEGCGHTFQSDHSDTEVLIHGHREWGAFLQMHLEGMYAYALWDRGTASLVLGRDSFGEKPLYHRIDDDQRGGLKLVVAASTAAAVGAVPPHAPQASTRDQETWVRRYLAFGCPWAGETMTPRGVRVVNVQPSGPPETQPTPADDETIETLLDQAVARRLEADVPLGCFLSGGVDSSLIAHFARKHKSDLQTYCVRMPDPRYDESRFAQEVARHLGTAHTTLSVAPEPAEDLVRLITLLGQPFGDSSLLPTFWVSRAAREHVKVALAGDGGDELFAGYERYLAANLLARRWRLLRRMPAGLWARAHPKSLRHKLGRLGRMADDFPLLGVAASEAIFTQTQIDELAPGPPRTRPREPDPLLAPPVSDEGDAAQQLRQCDLRRYLPDDLLCKVDTASMAVALEVRAPFLDRDLAAAVLGLPVKQLMAGRRRKGLLRRIARRHLPAEAVDRPKMGFAIPIGQWFQNDWGAMRTLLLDCLNSANPFGPVQLERRVVRRLIDEHLSGHRDHGQRLFTLLTLSLWARSGAGSGTLRP
jgi:asparagine synthase (glutamine-hydrolysing)